MDITASTVREIASTSTSRFDLWARVIDALRAKTVVEIGVWKGDFARFLLERCASIETYFMIDPWAPLPDWNKPLNVDANRFEQAFAEAMEKTSFAAGKRVVLRGRTKEVIHEIPDGGLDFAYIDGDHTLRGITIDLVKVLPKVKSHGLIAGDDFTTTPWQHDPRFEPTLVCPFSVYFSEAMDLPCAALPFDQFVIHKEPASVYRYEDHTGCHPATMTAFQPAGGMSLFHGRLEPAESPPRSLLPGEKATVPLIVTNTSEQTWPADGETPVRVSYHWLDVARGVVVHDGLRTALPGNLAAHASCELRADILSPSRPGEYVLQMTLVQENVAWFEEHAFQPFEAAVEVHDPESRFGARMEILQAPPAVLYPDEMIRMSASVSNTSRRTFPCAGDVPVHVSYHWLHEDGSTAIHEGVRTALPGDLEPAAGCDLTVVLQAPTVQGRYRLQLTLVQEHVAWFEMAWTDFQPPQCEVLVADPSTLSPSERQSHHATREALARSTEEVEYREWIRRFDTLSAADLASIPEHIATWSRRPLISVIMSTHDTRPEWLRESMESVVNQAYPDWELCVAADVSTEPEVRGMLQDFAAREPRIKLRFRDVHGNVCAAANTALEMAAGDYVVSLEQGDTLAPHCLYCIAGEIAADPEIAWVYFDWDRITEAGRRFGPNFTPPPNVDLFLSSGFMADHAAYRTDTVRQIGGYRAGYEASKDHDLGVRMLDVVKLEQIAHVPHVLYHERRPRARGTRADVRVVQEYLDRHGIHARATRTHRPPGCRIRHGLPEKDPRGIPLVTIIIPTRNRLDLLRPCMASVLEKTTYGRYEIIVIDNDSDDPDTLTYLDSLRQERIARVIRRHGQFNYAAMNNEAAMLADGELICFLNNDTEVIGEGWLTEMVTQALRPEIGAVGAGLWFDDNTVQHGGIFISHEGYRHVVKGQPRRAEASIQTAFVKNVSAVTGACLVVRKGLFQAVGGFNQRWLPVGYNDVELCFKIRQAGYRILCTPYAELFHHESLTRGRTDERAHVTWMNYMLSRWPETYQADRFFRAADDRVEVGKAVRKYRRAGTLFFLHLPKTAGSSLRKLVGAEYPGSGTFTVTARSMMECRDGKADALHRLRHSIRKCRAVFGHYGFGLHRLAGVDDPSYVTLLREPVARVVSHYNELVKAWRDAPGVPSSLADAGIVRMISKGIIPGNLMTRLLCGAATESATWDEIENGPCGYHANLCGFGVPAEVWRGEHQAILDRPDIPPDNDPAMLETAIRTIEKWFCFVGLTERLSEAVEILAEYLGWSEIPDVPVINVNAEKSIDETTIDREAAALIQEHNQLDIALYRHIRDLPGGYFLRRRPRVSRSPALPHDEQSASPSKVGRRKRCCIIHFGGHKTGSSSIQNSFFAGRRKLKDIHYLHVDQANASVPIATAFFDDPSEYVWNKRWGSSDEQIADRAEAAKARLAVQLEFSSKDRYLLSGEDIATFSESSLTRLIEWLSNWVDDIKAVGYVRPPASFAASHFQQLIREGVPIEWASLVPEYRKRFEVFDRVLGRDRVQFWKFEPSRFPEGCVVRDFCRRLGFQVPGTGIVRANDGLSRDALALVHAYNTHSSDRPRVHCSGAVLALLRHIPGEKVRLSAARIRSALAARREDISWMEDRMGELLEEQVEDEPAAVHDEADLLEFSRPSIDWLKRQLESHGIRVPASTPATPERVAEWMQAFLAAAFSADGQAALGPAAGGQKQ